MSFDKPTISRHTLEEEPSKAVGCFTSLRHFFINGLGHQKDLSQCKTPDESTVASSYNKSIDDDLTTVFTPETAVDTSVDLNESFDSSHRLHLLRSLMKANHITAYIVPSQDEHQSEYTAPKDQRREFISGFLGSAGIAVITLNSAALSTDGRYFLQAAKQLDSNWTLLKQGVAGYPTWQEWVVAKVQKEVELSKYVCPTSFGAIGVDPRLVDVSTGLDLKERCFNGNVQFVTDIETNLIDEVMKLDHYVPSYSDSLLFHHDLKYSGESTVSKLVRLRKFMAEQKCFALVISQLEEVAWLLNLRGDDIEFNPVFFSYVIIASDYVSLYVDPTKLSKEVSSYLKDCGITIYRYSQFWHDLPAIKSEGPKNVCIANNPSYALYTQVPTLYTTVRRSIVTEFKGIKNAVEIAGNRSAQLRDSVALCKFFAWLEETLHNGKVISEMDAANRAALYRSQQHHYRGLSFATISATGPNGSVVHYEPTEDECSTMDPNAVYLLDSGAQYLDGTTDITRTYHFGKPTQEERKYFSLVLAGHLNICMLEFAPGTSSYYIDSLAREPLRKHGLGYTHGTGHGIDTYICVHSGPCGFSPSKTSYNFKPLEPGNFLSDEPGCYKDNDFGVRIESDVLVYAKSSDLLAFEYMTKVPFGKNLLDSSYLTAEQISWVNRFHQGVYDKVSPFLQDDKRALAWLTRETSPLA